MKPNRIYYFIVFLFSVCMSWASDSRLKLEVEAYVLDGKVGCFDIYLRNVGSEPVGVVSGEIVDVYDGDVVVFCKARLPKTMAGELVKPSPRQVDIVTLQPNQLVKVGSVDRIYKKGEKVATKFVYLVPAELAKMYDVWTGKLELCYDSSESKR